VWDLISIQNYALFFKAMHHNLTQPYNIRQIKFKEEVEMKESTKDIILSAGFDVNSDVEVPEAAKFTKDMKEKLLHIENISRAEIKTLVNLFYQMQDIRKQLQSRSDQLMLQRAALVRIMKLMLWFSSGH
jgi:3-polyprenyl-4-hydroxybenzoate decarboxylase